MSDEKGNRRSSAFASSPSPTRRRLPTLAEVLARRTLPPVDLYCYYLFLQREGSEDSLDFWLDVQQHENLCRAYFKDLRRSGRALREEWPEYWRQARSRGSIYNRVNGLDDEDYDEYGSDGVTRTHGHTESETNFDFTSVGDDMTRSGHLGRNARTEDGTEDMLDDYDPTASAHPTSTGQYLRDRTEPSQAQTESTSEAGWTQATGPRFPGDPDYPLGVSERSNSQRRANLAKRASLAPTVIARSSAITKTDLVASAERIYARYLLPGSEKEIYLPPQLRIVSFPIGADQDLDDLDSEQMRALARVPDMFHPQKE